MRWVDWYGDGSLYVLDVARQRLCRRSTTGRMWRW
jgi:hypothetical protein